MVDKRTLKAPHIIQKTKRLSDAERAARKVAKTPAGETLFRYLMDELGYKQAAVVWNATETSVATDAMINNEARRGVYLQLRALLTPELRNKIESERVDQYADSDDDADATG